MKPRLSYTGTASFTVRMTTKEVDGEAGFHPAIVLTSDNGATVTWVTRGGTSEDVAEARAGQMLDVLLARVVAALGADGYTVERNNG